MGYRYLTMVLTFMGPTLGAVAWALSNLSTGAMIRSTMVGLVMGIFGGCYYTHGLRQQLEHPRPPSARTKRIMWIMIWLSLPVGGALGAIGALYGIWFELMAVGSIAIVASFAIAAAVVCRIERRCAGQIWITPNGFELLNVRGDSEESSAPESLRNNH